VPWKKLFTFVGIYSLIVFGLFAILKPSQMLQSLPGLLFGAGVALVVMAVLSKFGWQPTMLKNKTQIAEARAERDAARAARRGGGETATTTGTGGTAAAPSRARPAPTKRTTPGATNNPRRTRDTRKR
jgi:hypothetical protein